MLLSETLQSKFMENVNPLPAEYARTRHEDIPGVSLSKRAIRFNGVPQRSVFDIDVLNMFKWIHISAETGFRMYIACVPCLDYMRPVVVLGFGYRFDHNAVDGLGMPVVWVYQDNNYIEIDWNETSWPMPFKHLDYGFQPVAQNIKARLQKFLDKKTVEWLESNGDLQDQFQSNITSANKYTDDPRFWYDRLDLVTTAQRMANREKEEAQRKYNELKTLIGSRIQADGSKVMFKAAQHYVDLQKTFADQLMQHFK